LKDVVLHSEARAELDDAVAFYEERREGLGVEFLTVIEKAFERIQENPKQGSIYRDSGHRKLVVRKFPYVLFFRELSDRIRITAIAHAKRRPGYWKGRAAPEE
jgi:toxin ParE1/3/4